MDARSRRTPPSIPGYRVERALGEGGMATAWLAVQKSLGREVVLKVLDPALAADEDFVERFVREARVLASLRHRHIVAIHDVGVAGGVPYLAMEFLEEGSTAPLCGHTDAATALRCVREIADALGHAHARGIIHRDVKPENILRGKGGEFVLGDFGIARVSDGAALTAPTAPGLAFGTPAYMAPERWRDGPVDGRSDFYSLGCVLFALLAGRPPFQASEQVALGHKHLSEPVPLLPAPFEALQGLFARLLAKDPDDRHPDAASIVAHVQALEHELGADGKPLGGDTRLLSEWPFGAGHKLLEPVPPATPPGSQAASRSRVLAFGFGALVAVTLLVVGWLSRGGPGETPPPAPKPPVVAVLPFTTEGDDADLGRLANVLSEDLATQLARQAGVRLVARASVLAAPAGTDLRDLAQRLGAERLVTGEIALNGTTLELALRIIDARTGMARWTGAVAGQPERLWQLESRAVQALATDLLPGQTLAATEIAGRAQDAFPDYLRGRKLLSATGGEDLLPEAVQAFEAALQTDPSFAPAFAGICRAQLRAFAQHRDSGAFKRANSACERAVELDPTLGEVVLAQGDLHRFAAAPELALGFYDRAVDDPVVGLDARLGRAAALGALGRATESDQEFIRSQALEPGYWRGYFDHGNSLLQRGSAEAAIVAFQMAQRFAPANDTRVANNLGSALLALGRFEEAAAAYESSLAMRRSYSNLSNLGTVRFYLGDYRGSAELYEQAIALGPEDYRPYANLADAQSLVPELAARAKDNYREAARRAEAFLAVQRNSIDAATELAWYWINLGEEERARSMADTAMHGLESGDHALRLAAVYRRLGDDQRASEAVTRARDLGLSPRFIDATPWLREVKCEDTGANAVRKSTCLP